MKPILSLTIMTLLFTYNTHAKKDFNLEARKVSCENKTAGEACTFTGKKGERTGSCKESKKDKSLLLCLGNKANKGKMFKDLNLTKEQFSKIKEYRETKKKNRDEMKSLKATMKNLREDVKKGFLSNVSDENLLSIHKKISETRTKLEELRFSKMIAMKNILNEEQRQKFIEQEDKRKEKLKKKRTEKNK